jgi:hypothetical protein
VTQTIPTMTAGSYNITVVCEDEIGNTATNNTFVKLEFDNQDPIITRIYGEGGNLKMLTDESAICYYNTNPAKGCIYTKDENSTDIVKITSSYSTTHSTKWDSGKTYYIKCYDIWENAPAECNIIAKADNIKVKSPKSITFK